LLSAFSPLWRSSVFFAQKKGFFNPFFFFSFLKIN